MNAFNSFGGPTSNPMSHIFRTKPSQDRSDNLSPTHSPLHLSYSEKKQSNKNKPKNSQELSIHNDQYFLNRTMEAPAKEKPFMVFVYKQKIEVEGQGIYEIKMTNLLNPHTLKATPLQPSLINPVYFLQKGIGINNKTISLNEDQVHSFIANQNNLKYRNQQSKYKQLQCKKTTPCIQNRISNHLKHQGGAYIKLINNNRISQQLNQTTQKIKKQRQLFGNSKESMTKEDIVIKKKEFAILLLKKVMIKYIRRNFKQVQANSFNYFLYRNMKKRITLMQVINKINIKIQQKKTYAFNKLKEHVYSSQNQSKSINDSNNSYRQNVSAGIKSQNNETLQSTNFRQEIFNKDKNYSDIIQVQQLGRSTEKKVRKKDSKKVLVFSKTNSTNEATDMIFNQKKIKKQGMQKILNIIERKYLNNIFSFWLPFKAQQKKQQPMIVNEFKLNFDKQVYNAQEIEQMMANNINRIEIVKLEDNLKLLEKELEQSFDESLQFEEQKYGQTYRERKNSHDNNFSKNVNNISGIQSKWPTQVFQKNESITFGINSQFKERMFIDKHITEESIDKDFEELEDESSEFVDQFDFLTSRGRESVMSKNYEENRQNIFNINTDIQKLTQELEQIKKLMFQQQQINEIDENMEIQQLSKQEQEGILHGKKYFKNDEDMLNYYEMKVGEDINEEFKDKFDQLMHQSHTKKIEYYDKQQKVERKHSDEWRNQIKNFKGTNLNDSREKDFEGFEDFM